MTPTAHPEPLSAPQLRRSLTLSIIEGGCYAVMVGFGEAYFVADGVRLGGTGLQLGLLVGLPLAVGGVAASLGLSLLRFAPRRRPVVAGLVLLQAILLLALAALEGAGASSPGLLLLAVSVYQAFGQLAGALWSSWYGDLVPAMVRGRFFSTRSRVVHLCTFLALISGGLLLQHAEPGGGPASGGTGSGFLVLFLLAGLARLVSAALLLASPEPHFARPPAGGSVLRHLRSAEGRGASRVLGLAALLNFGVYLGSPYFGPFMLEGLRLDYRSYMLANAAQVAAKVLSLRAFGRAIDAHGAAAVYRLAVLLVALIPIPWLMLDGLYAVILVQAFSGFAWAAHEIGLLTLLLGQSEPRSRPLVFGGQSLLNGQGQLFGSLVGAQILERCDGSFRAVFAATLVGRIAVAFAVPLLMRGLIDRGGIGQRGLLLRVIGFRPSGGVVHRPVDEGDDDDTAELPATPADSTRAADPR